MSANGHRSGNADTKSALDLLTRRFGPNEALDRLRTALDQLALEETALASKLTATLAQLEREQLHARLLAHASSVVNSSLELPTVLRSVLELAVDVMNAERGFIMLADERGELALGAMHNLDRSAIESDGAQLSTSIVRRVFDSGEAVVTTDAQNDPRFSSQNSIVSLQIRSIVCVPLKHKERTIGVVYLDSRLMSGAFNRHDPELLMAVANQAAMALENARLFAAQEAQLHEIQRLQAFQARLLSAITSGVITLDRAHLVRTLNDAASATFGIAPDEVLDKPVSALDAVIPGFSAAIAQFTVAGRIGARFELEGEHRGRGPIVVEARIAPMDVDNDQGIAIAIGDLTTQRTLERQAVAEAERSRKIEESFSRYLAPHIVQSLMQDPDRVQLGGDRQQATILFADIRGFTAMSSQMRADAVVELLNGYLDEAVAVVFAHDGLLDKFYGDGLMAVFGPPRARPDDAARAIRTALALHAVVAEIRPRLARPIQIGIGLATGEVVSGRIGSTRRMDYTVIGHAVNLASRLQAVAPPGAVYLDEATYLNAKLDVPAERLSARLKGREEPIAIYSLKV